MYKVYLNLGKICEHCLQPIESRPNYNVTGIITSGFEPMEHRHIHNKSDICTITKHHNVRPYSDNGVRNLYDEALHAKSV